MKMLGDSHQYGMFLFNNTLQESSRVESSLGGEMNCLLGKSCNIWHIKTAQAYLLILKSCRLKRLRSTRIYSCEVHVKRVLECFQAAKIASCVDACG